MAPRKPKDDDAASTASSIDHPTVLKPNTTKAKVEKSKSAKPKAVRKSTVKKEKKVDDGEVGDTDGGDGEFGEREVKEVKKRVVKPKVKKEAGDGEDVKAGKGAGGRPDGKGEKVKPVTGDEAVSLILGYLKAQNRPYSATEVSANLHNKVTKTVADKLLKEMEQNRQIMGKATKKDGGGQWVFWPIQDPSDAASPEELATMDTLITTLKESMPTLRTTFKTITTNLTTLQKAPTTSELSSIISSLQTSNAAKKEKLEGFKSGAVKIVTKQELEKVEKEYKYWAKKRVDRKKAFQGVEDLLLQGEMTREDTSNAAKKEKLEGFKSGAVKIVTKQELEKVEKEYKYWAKKRVDRKKAFQGVEDLLLQGEMTREDVWEKDKATIQDSNIGLVVQRVYA
ncbi:uncharacterized protein PAC_07517 [Phialocephala subalpina]|uniref:Homologous-pairing protein 2 winged helix domain-containing protein n=1 Tax=Phialocephala subalpina TaxID=576137 RepID=A0A1L7WXY3_9HELO|nr:uncharacterized protein PAC_07517 [Phialocephala subalpina]